jgi:hypothetical protein
MPRGACPVAAVFMEETVQRLGFRTTPEAIEWNDAPGRTFERCLSGSTGAEGALIDD